MKKNLLIPMLVLLAILCLSASCGLTDAEDPTSGHGDMATTGETPSGGSDVLDKGGANPTDNVTIVNPEISPIPSVSPIPDVSPFPEVSPFPSASAFPEDGLDTTSDSLLQDLRDGASEVLDGTH